MVPGGSWILALTDPDAEVLRAFALKIRRTGVRRVLPTSASDGMIEYVPSISLARVLAEHRTISRFLQIHHPDPSGSSPETFGCLASAASQRFSRILLCKMQAVLCCVFMCSVSCCLLKMRIGNATNILAQAGVRQQARIPELQGRTGCGRTCWILLCAAARATAS